MDIHVDNGKMDFEKYIEKTANHLDFQSNSLIEVGKGIFLSYKEKNILDQYQISYQNCSSLKEIIYLIENALEENDDSLELLEISDTISERDYYCNTNK